LIKKVQQITKPHIVFTLPACMGGVASFNYNLINYSKLIKKFHSKVILLQAKEDNWPAFKDIFQADEVVIFHFSYKENQYYVQQRLNKIMGAEEGAIVTDNPLTIQAARRFNNSKTVFHLVHDFYYVSQSIQCGDLVDVAIAHSSFFSDAVFAANPVSFVHRTYHIPYGVQQLKAMPKKNNPVLKLLFLGRLEESKGVLLLYEINKKLAEQNIQVDWSIIGKGSLKNVLKEQWGGQENVRFFEPDSVEEVYKILGQQDIFVFPTTFEGTPVSILESLANGVVTIVNDLPGGVRDIVIEGIGFRCPLNDITCFSEHIATLHHNRALLENMQENCFELANKQYDIATNADNYFKLFLSYRELKRAQKNAPLRMSRLDKKGISNRLVKTIRKFR
jgi:glycosyltransferase involved in cell wall biosynthesis